MLVPSTWILWKTPIILTQIEILARQISKISKLNLKWARSHIFIPKTSHMARILSARLIKGLIHDYRILRLVLVVEVVVRAGMTPEVSPASSKITSYPLLRPEEMLRLRPWSSKRPMLRWLGLKRRLSRRHVNLTRMQKMLKLHSKFSLMRGSKRTCPCSTRWHSSRPSKC